MCSQSASFRQKHANKWCLGLKPPTYSQIPPLLRDLPAQILKTFIWPNIPSELQHAEEATAYHVGHSCQHRDAALLPLPPFLHIQGQNYTEICSLGVWLCTTSLGFKFKRKWEELNCDLKHHFFKTSRATAGLTQTAHSYSVCYKSKM